MCPACIASAAWIAAGVTSTSGLTALAAKLVGSKLAGSRLVGSKQTAQQASSKQTTKEK
jgi:hypothetical protein